MTELKEYSFNGKNIFLVGVTHNQRDLNTQIMRQIVDKANTKSKVCYLIEFDRRLTNKELKNTIPRTEEMTTKFIISELKREYGKLYNNLCIRGWDARAALLDNDISGKKDKSKRYGRKSQNKLYSKEVLNLNIKSIQNYIMMLPNNYKINTKQFSPKIGKYLNNSFNNEDTYLSLRKKDNNQSLFDWLYYNVKGYISHIKSKKEPENFKINELRGIMGGENVDRMIFHLRLAFARVSDLYLLEKILEKDNDTSYVVFMGMIHYKNVVNHFKNLGI